MNKWIRAGLLLLALPLVAGKCGEGDGSGGKPPVIRRFSLECGLALPGAFPPALVMLPGAGDRAALVLDLPSPSLVGIDLDSQPPRIIGQNPVKTLPSDSDGDGIEDVAQQIMAGFSSGESQPARLGDGFPAAEDLVLVSASNFEELVFWNPSTGDLVEILVENPPAGAGHDPDAYPFLPDAGTSAPRTALSTRRCISDLPSEHRETSSRQPVPSEPRCDASAPSFFTSFTGAATLSGDHLFVSTANLDVLSASFLPGTILVYSLDLDSRPIRARPDTQTPVIFTTGFNPIALSSYRTPTGRNLILVNVAGAIGVGAGDSNVLTAGAIDVIDVDSGRLAATIPLGLAGSFNSLVTHPSGRVAIAGASSHRRMYAVDLAPLDDPSLYPPRTPLPVLDGSMNGLPDARIFWVDVDPDAQTTFDIPAREGGPHPRLCNGVTDVDFSANGRRAYVGDACDGTLAVVDVDLSGNPDTESLRTRFRLDWVEALLAPLVPDSIDDLRSLGNIEVRPGEPGDDYAGPDVYFTAGQPEGELCGVRVDSFLPAPSP